MGSPPPPVARSCSTPTTSTSEGEGKLARLVFLFSFVLSGHWEYRLKAKRAQLARAEERRRQAAASEEAAKDQECRHRNETGEF